MILLFVHLEECFKRWGVIWFLDLGVIKKNMLKDVKGANLQGPKL
jgi:hypothetical protein